MKKDNTGKANSKIVTTKTNSPTLAIDWELYGKYLEESDLSDTEKRAFLESLWSIVVSFVDLGFGVHPVQQAAGKICEHQAEIAKFIATQSPSVVSSTEPSTTNFNAAADRHSTPSQERNSK